MKTLVVVRHARAGSGQGLPDLERPLEPGGELDAHAAGELIRPLEPQLILASPAVRARRTAELLGLDAPIEIEREIYEGYADVLIGVLRRTGAEVGTLVLVGHNPGVHDLVVSLTGARQNGFAAGACAVIEVDGPWEDLGAGSGRLVRVHQP